MMPATRHITTASLELQFGTTHIGHMALVVRIGPLMRAGRARATTMSSGAGRTGRIAWARDEAGAAHLWDLSERLAGVEFSA
jgi:NAD(P)-dependent dehydrogenase (short-subunit alcohol dehydrogenase family)